MKFIDEKGRIFSKVNIVDLIVLIVIIALVAGIGVKFMSSRGAVGDSTGESEEQYCYVTIVARLQPEEVGEYLNVGDHLVANGGYTDAEIVDVTVEPANYVGVSSDGTTVLSEHPLWKDITVIAKEKIDPTDVTLKVGGQEVRVGYDYILKTQTVEADAVIWDIEWKSE